MPQSQARLAGALALRRPTRSEAARTAPGPERWCPHGLGGTVGTQPHTLFPSPGRAALPSLKITAETATAPALSPTPKSFGNLGTEKRMKSLRLAARL